MTVKEALFNWLQIKVVSDARPQDRSAEETTRFFHHILKEDHGVEEIQVRLEKDGYHVRYRQSDHQQEVRYDREQVEQLLISIEAEPKYNQTFGCGPEEG
ncbi:hypothetical protein [Desmospora profundinema]|uniref:Uncharacterized protein n=1 Tax=Desmospora profundinema TaxID=1571184 RepID=A0ABU1IJ94_9BACL|nr:hypothetical protein [Desmospora profundinema]MDR6224851.1 hypothetical protein [Desmospora profundinema]